MKTGLAIIRILIYLIVTIGLFEFFIDSGDEPAVFKYPIIWGFVLFVLLFSIAIEMIKSSLEGILFKSMDEDAQAQFLIREKNRKEEQYAWFYNIYKKLTASKPIEEEGDIILDHNYDGIKELDNRLPPWWVYGFYITIIFAVIYLARFHIFGGADQAEEYAMAVEEARIQIEEYKKTAKDLVDINTVELLTEASDLNSGKTIFTANCVACHKMDGGGGIGPNLTDDYWIIGGGIKNVFNTISEGGRPGKGMISWKSELKPSEIAQVASYVLSLHGTTPADPKDPEGEIWVDENAPVDEAKVEISSDSTEIKVIIENDPVIEDLDSSN
ncbi:cbb3-type cytochrome c oxidase N-terminal domain-containing protein [Aegicerativicinus sediminis]